MTTKELTAEEQAFFDNGGDTSGLPADYAADVKLSAPDEGEHGAAATPDDTQAQAADAQAGEAAQGGDSSEKTGDEAAAAEGEAKKTVPVATLMEERRKRQETERTLQELQRQQAVVNERLAAIAAASAAREEREAQAARQAQQEQQRANEPQVPDPEVDPVGAAKWAVDQITAQQRQQQEYQQMSAQQRQQHERQQHYVGQVLSVTAQKVQEYRQQDPTFDEAQSYLLNLRYQERMFNGETPEQAAQNLKRDEFTFYDNALRQGRDPAAHLMEYAKVKGYRPQAQQAGQGASQAAQQLDRVAQGQQASVSPSTAGTSGNARSGKLDAKTLADMSKKEFEEFLAKDKDGDAWRKVMGA